MGCSGEELFGQALERKKKTCARCSSEYAALVLSFDVYRDPVIYISYPHFTDEETCLRAERDVHTVNGSLHLPL